MGGGRLGGQKWWEVGNWVVKICGGWEIGWSKFAGGGRLGVKICGRWEIGTPVSPPPIVYRTLNCSANKSPTSMREQCSYFI